MIILKTNEEQHPFVIYHKPETVLASVEGCGVIPQMESLPCQSDEGVKLFGHVEKASDPGSEGL